MRFAERLRYALRSRGLTQGQLSVKAGVSPAHISMVLSEQREVGVDVAARLARALDVSLDWLCDLPERQADTLEPDEDELLVLYRAMSDVGQSMAIDMARVIVERAREAAPNATTRQAPAAG